jgi:hypothetical protein
VHTACEVRFLRFAPGKDLMYSDPVRTRGRLFPADRLPFLCFAVACGAGMGISGGLTVLPLLRLPTVCPAQSSCSRLLESDYGFLSGYLAHIHPALSVIRVPISLLALVSFVLLLILVFRSLTKPALVIAVVLASIAILMQSWALVFLKEKCMYCNWLAFLLAIIAAMLAFSAQLRSPASVRLREINVCLLVFAFLATTLIAAAFHESKKPVLDERVLAQLDSAVLFPLDAPRVGPQGRSRLAFFGKLGCGACHLVSVRLYEARDRLPFEAYFHFVPAHADHSLEVVLAQAGLNGYYWSAAAKILEHLRHEGRLNELQLKEIVGVQTMGSAAVGIVRRDSALVQRLHLRATPVFVLEAPEELKLLRTTDVLALVSEKETNNEN